MAYASPESRSPQERYLACTDFLLSTTIRSPVNLSLKSSLGRLDASFLNQQYRRRRASEAREISCRLLDMRMPPPDGVELARQIRASRVNASTVIVMITGEENGRDETDLSNAGVEFFLFKPSSAISS